MLAGLTPRARAKQGGKCHCMQFPLVLTQPRYDVLTIHGPIIAQEVPPLQADAWTHQGNRVNKY